MPVVIMSSVIMSGVNLSGVRMTSYHKDFLRGGLYRPIIQDLQFHPPLL